MKVKKVVLVIFMTAMVLSGCGHSNEKTTQDKSNLTQSKQDHKSATKKSAATVRKNSREDAPIEYANANYFKEKVREIIYYRDGKRYIIPPDTEQGKKVLILTKLRYVNTGEYVLRKNMLKKRVSSLQNSGKALEIKFEKKCDMTYTGGKSNDYKKVFIRYQSWFYPLEGEEAKYFVPLPNKECTYESLGDAKNLLKYLENNI
ncbi:MAG: hypothetical protein Q4F98_02460 [Lachnospiraceae bacterium]|nr:hypothetical protein [Lachnospiraceae bacterium]